jgi:2-iminobutanoate/2-iminopropanoate deaminase
VKMQRVTSPHVKEAPPGTWSNCRVCGNQIFVAGMTANDGKGSLLGDGSMYSQAKETFSKIKHLATPQLLVEVNAIGFLGGSAGA